MRAEDAIRLGVAVAAGVGPVGARAARDRHGGWAAARDAAQQGDAGFPAALRTAFLAAPETAGRVQSDCRREGIGILLRGDPEWPPALEALTDEPEVLFFRGRTSLFRERGIALVGARECSPHGAAFTRRLASRLAEEGWSVVSGLARGIDAAAHQGALDAGGDTAAVLGCGLDVTYPPENAALQGAVAASGLLLSEFAPGARPRAHHFPRRNRVLAGLAQAVVVVESRLRSGALVTAKHALEQGREIFAVPGRPGTALAEGPLQLLRQGARPIRHAEDLLEDLGGVAGQPSPGLEEMQALEALHSGGGEGAAPSHVLSVELGISAAEARERLARLELLGLLPGETP